MKALITGGSGYFGSLIVTKTDAQWVSMVNDAQQSSFIKEIFGISRVSSSFSKVIHHNVAPPLAKDHQLFELNIQGTEAAAINSGLVPFF